MFCVPRLTPAERTVVELALQGKASSEIAEVLGWPLAAVKADLRKIRAKFPYIVPAEPGRPTKKRISILTRVEREVAELILQSMKSSEIAGWLGCAPATAKKHFRNIRKKFGLREDSLHWMPIKLALLIHERRAELGVSCQACGEMSFAQIVKFHRRAMT